MQAGITFVTEAHVLEPGVPDQLDGWLALIRGLAADNHVHLPVTSDLFVEIDQKSGNCYYYFADHGHRTVFWLHAVDTTTVGLPDSCSKDHLRESRTSFAPFRSIEIREQNTLWRRTTGPMSRCSPMSPPGIP